MGRHMKVGRQNKYLEKNQDSLIFRKNNDSLVFYVPFNIIQVISR